MAITKIPDPLERRHLLEKDLGAERARAVAEAYLAEGRSVEAVDFLRKAEANDRLADLCREAVENGDVFQLRSCASAMGVRPSREEWQALAAAAEAGGRDLDAADARRLSEREEE